ncbi:MAG: hypothetical protein ACI9DC_001452 [Gammaproteobacteria bacterium]|jgi:hypothetical protein
MRGALGLCMTVFAAGTCADQLPSWFEPTRNYYDGPARFAWRHSEGDWLDLAGAEQGEVPFARTTSDATQDDIEWDVTTLVRAWISTTLPNNGLMLRISSNKATLVFESLESGTDSAPELILQMADSTQMRLRAQRDAHVDRSTTKTLAARRKLSISSDGKFALIAFELPPELRAADLRQAVLRLRLEKHYGKRPFSIDVFAADPGGAGYPEMPRAGLAVGFENDQGIERHPQVIFASGFERETLAGQWGDQFSDRATLVTHDEVNAFEVLAGEALSVTVPAGKLTGLNASVRFADRLDREPEELFFRYYLRLSPNWIPATGGKLPGISGDYGRAGWGGRTSNGANGWSMRGRFGIRLDERHPLANGTALGFYAYHAKMTDTYGDNWIWERQRRGVVAPARWYAIEQHVKLNTPGKPDGVARAWVDGRLAFEKSDVQFRTTDELKIERVWMNVYHGGTKPAPRDLTLFIDNVVVARQYIGPMNRGTRKEHDQWWFNSR